MAAVRTPKEAVRQLLEVPPDDCSFEETLYRIYVRQKVAEGLSLPIRLRCTISGRFIDEHPLHLVS